MPEKLRAFEVTVLKTFSNFQALKHYIVVSEKRPQPEDVEGMNEKLMEIKELNAEVIIK
jgi:hypothetical protein